MIKFNVLKIVYIISLSFIFCIKIPVRCYGTDEPTERNWQIHFELGEKYYRNDKYQKAVNEYLLALKYKKDSYLIYFSLGASYRKLGKFEHAVKSWETALKYKVDDMLIKKLVGKLKTEINVKKEMTNLKEKISKNPNDLESLLNLAELYNGTQNYKLAAIILESVLKKDPGNKKAFTALASLKSSTGKLGEAISLLEKYIKLYKDDENILKELNIIKEYKKLLSENRFIGKKRYIDLNRNMVLIPSGDFFLGTNDTGIETGVDERPEQKIFLPSFYLDRFEVTNIQYKKFVKEAQHEIPFHWKSNRKNNMAGHSPHNEESKFTGEFYPEKVDYYPITYITWLDADSFCRWAGKRLPTEQEWEKAARGIDKRIFPWGNKFDKNKANTAHSLFKGPTPIGSYPDGVSPYGIYDMSGNVWEWTESWYDGYKGTTLERDSFGQKLKVARGGSFLDPPELHARAMERHAELPTLKHRSIGFRCAKDGLK